MSTYRLSIDYGTTYSVGVVSSDAGTEVLELNRSRYFPSLVLLDPDGELLVGNSAVNQAALYPDRVCATPKRLVGRPAILMGGEVVEVHRAIAAVLARLAEEAARRFGGAAPDSLVLSHPALWAQERIGVLAKAARAAGLPDPELVPEPVAAAGHYADGSLAEGANVAVYDLGGGTFDAAVLRRTKTGFEVAGRPGGDPNLGGEDFDNELRELVEEHAARIDPERFEAARQAESARRQWSVFRREIREAKEALSDELKCPLAVPGIDDPILVTRRELEALLEPHLSRTIEQLAATIADAGLTPKDLAAVYLTGGSSRIPLISTLLSQELGLRPQTWGDPKAVVALGALQSAKPDPGHGRAGSTNRGSSGRGEADSAVVTCPSCGTRNRVPVDGRAARCARCSTPLPRPAPTSEAREHADLGDAFFQHVRTTGTEAPGWQSAAGTGRRAEPGASAPGADGTAQSAEPPSFPARLVILNTKQRYAAIALDTDRDRASARIAHLLEAVPVQLGPENIEFRHAQAPNENLRLHFNRATTAWLSQARTQFESVRELRVSLVGPAIGVSLRNRRPATFGPHEWYVQVFGLTPYGDDRKAFEPFVHSFCAALSGGTPDTSPGGVTAPQGFGSASPPAPAAPQGGQPGGELLVYQNRPWLQITNRRFTLKGLLGGIKLDVPVEEILSFKGDGISAVRVVLRDGRTERWNCGVQNKEKMLKALEQVTGRRRG